MKGRMAIGRAMRGLLAALALALPPLAPASAGSVASAGSPARVSVSIPAAAKDAGIVMLEIGISARRPASGHLGAVVRLRPPGGVTVELGRISVTAGGEQRYQFNAGALKRAAGGSAEVEVELIDRGGGNGPLASGAELSVDQARIVTR